MGHYQHAVDVPHAALLPGDHYSRAVQVPAYIQSYVLLCEGVPNDCDGGHISRAEDVCAVCADGVPVAGCRWCCVQEDAGQVRFEYLMG